MRYQTAPRPGVLQAWMIAAGRSQPSDAQESLAHEPAHQHEAGLLVERARQLGGAERAVAFGHGLDRRRRLGREPQLLALEDEHRSGLVALELEDDGRAPLEQRVDGESLERPQLGELVVEDRPAPGHEAPPSAAGDLVRPEPGREPLDQVVRELAVGAEVAAELDVVRAALERRAQGVHARRRMQPDR